MLNLSKKNGLKDYKLMNERRPILDAAQMIKGVAWLVFPLILTVVIAYIEQGSLGELMTWLGARSGHVFAGYCIIWMILLIFYGVFGKTFLAVGFTSLFLMVMALVNYFKITVRGDPFVPWDILLGQELTGIMSNIQITWTVKIVLLILFVLLLVAASFLIKDRKMSIKKRITLLVISIGCLALSFQFVWMKDTLINQMGIYYVNWSQERNYEYNGFLVGFCINMRNVMIHVPEGYNEANVKTVAHETAKEAGNADEDFKPNIIMVMNESFWDPTKLENVEFSTNPIPNIEKLRKEAMSGWILTEQYGGGTANSEFEVLTGNATMFFPSGAIAYQQYIKDKQPSLASYLKDRGYQTVAIHSYVDWFWNREDVYPLIGFDAFISRNDFENPTIRGNYISDASTVDKLIETYEEKKAESDAPFFGFAVTMENHSTYEAKKYPTRNITAEAPNASDEANNLINNYVQGVKDADAALGELIDYFSKVDEPTIVVMYGDHLPMLGDNYLAYKETGYIGEGEWRAEDYINMYTTPFVAWNNYDLKQEDLGIMNAHYLAPTILSKMNVKVPEYYKFLLNLKEQIPAYTRYVCLDEEGQPSLEPSETMKAAANKHWLLQYDMMFGKDYVTDKLMSGTP